MTKDSPEFEALLAHYQEIIDRMPDEFTSHEFILALAHDYQREYIALLYTYRTHETPFMVCHLKIAKGLNRFREQLAKLKQVPSTDIFGTHRYARKWRKTGC